MDSGAITTSEARPLRQQIRYLAQLERRYAAKGLSQTERKDLQRRFKYTASSCAPPIQATADTRAGIARIMTPTPKPAMSMPVPAISR